MGGEAVSARIKLSEYANKVFGIIKIKFGLNDKSEAINKFVELYGEDILDKDATEEYTKKVIGIANRHFKKYASRRMTIEELDKFCEA